MKATKIKSLALGLLVALAGLSGCISYDNQDQYCDAPNSNPATCPYGPPGGAKFAKRPACDEIISLPAGDAQCIGASSWEKDIWPAIGASCAGGSACHAGGAKGIKLLPDATAARSAYDTLSSYTGASERPYISSIQPAKAWILCNLDPRRKDGGVIMPPGGNADILKKVETWAQCGQRF